MLFKFVFWSSFLRYSSSYLFSCTKCLSPLEKMTDLMLEHYKERYSFYKKKCEKMERVLGRFRELLETVREQTSTPLNSPSTPVMSDNQPHVDSPQQSPILCRGAKRTLFNRSVKEKKCKEEEKEDEHGAKRTLFNSSVKEKKCKEEEEEDEDEEYRNFELGSNKWECVDLPDNSGNDSSPELLTPPLERLKKLKKYSGLELWGPTVSNKIRGVERREMPGWPCDQCRSYYEVNNFGPEIMKKVSRHRCTHERVRSPKGFWSLDMDHLNKHQDGGSDTSK